MTLQRQSVHTTPSHTLTLQGEKQTNKQKLRGEMTNSISGSGETQSKLGEFVPGRRRPGTKAACQEVRRVYLQAW